MEHVNGWCFRGIYKGGLWENDLHVSAHMADRVTSDQEVRRFIVFLSEITLLLEKLCRHT